MTKDSYELETIDIDLFWLVENGERTRFAMSQPELSRALPKAVGSHVVEREAATAGVAQGEVLDWSKRGGYSRNAKLHWTCPNCGQMWWEDFVGEVRNPYLAGSGCRCVDLWLVNWDQKQVDDELSLATE